jgi:hypothetical protein
MHFMRQRILIREIEFIDGTRQLRNHDSMPGTPRPQLTAKQIFTETMLLLQAEISKNVYRKD